MFLSSERMFFAFDNPVSADKAMELEETGKMLNNYVLTVNEVRQAKGLEPVSWGDLPMVSFGVAPLGTAPEMIYDDQIDGKTIHPDLEGVDVRVKSKN
jgi:ribosomal protein L5